MILAAHAFSRLESQCYLRVLGVTQGSFHLLFAIYFPAQTYGTNFPFLRFNLVLQLPYSSLFILNPSHPPAASPHNLLAVPLGSQLEEPSSNPAHPTSQEFVLGLRF
jgi:hypothetical protein